MKIGSYWIQKDPSTEVEPFTKGAKYRIVDYHHRMFSDKVSQWLDSLLVVNVDDPSDAVEVTEEYFYELYREVAFELVSSQFDMKNE